MGRGWTGQTSMAGCRSCILHFHSAFWLLTPFWCCQSSPGYGHCETKMPAEKMRLIRRLWGAECENWKEDRRSTRKACDRFGHVEQELRQICSIEKLIGME